MFPRGPLMVRKHGTEVSWDTAARGSSRGFRTSRSVCARGAPRGRPALRSSGPCASQQPGSGSKDSVINQHPARRGNTHAQITCTKHTHGTHTRARRQRTRSANRARACASTHTDMRRAHRCSACSGRGRRGPWGSRLSRSARGTGVNRDVQIKLAYICHMGMCIWDDCQVFEDGGRR